MSVVNGFGPRTSRWMIVGEAPGKYEAAKGRPFVGPSGKEQDSYLARHGLHSSQAYKTNVVKLFVDGNPDPSPLLIKQWTPTLLDEMEQVAPLVVLAIGRFAMRWYLGAGASLKACHGLPHRAGAFDSSLRDRGGPNDAIIVPCTHPAAGMYNNDVRAVIGWDYAGAAEVVKARLAGREVRVREDEWAGREKYEDLTGRETAEWLDGAFDLGAERLAIDTEGSVESPWSIQLSIIPGHAVVLRTSQPDFEVGIQAIQRAVDGGALVTLHNASTPQGCGWDIQVCQSMGLDLTGPHVRLWDTMYAAYLLRLEPQGLKALAYRWAGMMMEDYKRVISTSAADRQLAYLGKVLDHEWPKVEPRLEMANDGTFKLHTPNHVHRRVDRILADYGTLLLTPTDDDQLEEDPDKEDESTDFLLKRWLMVDPPQRHLVESVLGPMPRTTLDDVPLDKAVWYSGRDADATLRISYRLAEELERRGLTSLMDTGMSALPVFYEMQQTGLPVSRVKFETLRDRLSDEMERLGSRISHRYYGGKPFNPKSTKQVAALMRRRGLESAKRTAKGAMSTGKEAIEHLRTEDEAVGAVIEWREMQHIKDMFCEPTLTLLGESDGDIRCKLKVTRTTTRRLASFDPNFLAFPKHDKPGGVDYGKQVRSCFVCPPGEVLLESDYSQIEVRVLAHESRDPLLCKLFTTINPATGKLYDVHTETAARVFGVPSTEISKEDVRRFFAKRVTFGIAYGVTGSGLAKQLRMAGAAGWSVDECNRLIREWLKLYKGAAQYFADVEAQVLRTGEVRDCWGMVRYLPAVWSDDEKVAAEARRQAVNHRIQGGAQGMIQRAMVYLRPQVRSLQDMGIGVKWCLQVHDALLMRVPEEAVEIVQPLIETGMVEGCGKVLRVPVVVDSHTARSWGEL